MTKLRNVFIGLLLGLMCIAQQAQAYSDKQVFIPIANGDTTIIIPLLGTPSPSVSTQSNSLGSVYAMSWSAISGASYYEILLIENGELFETIRVTDTSYNLSIPPGTFDARIMACNAEDKCGAAVLIGTYTASERVRFAHADILGSPILETDIAGNVHREYHYQPFGETKEEKNEDIGYTGHLEDTDLKLTYMQARYYDPVLGRFYANDPVEYTSENPVMSFNRYLYVNNNPYKYTDPNGEFFNLALGVIGATVGAITGGVSSYVTSGGDLGATLQGAGIGAGIGALAGITGGASIVGFGKAADMSWKASSASSAMSMMGASSLKMAATSAASNAAGQIAGGADEINMTQVATSAAGGLLPGAGAGAILASTGTKTVNSVAGTALATVVADTSNIGTQVVANEVAEDIDR